jgi:Aminoglycoside-2''-adenylyltransferase
MANLERQLELLHQVAIAFDAARMRFWLRGGWALDFLQGSVTRQHEDIDLITWQRHEVRVGALLQKNHFSVVRHLNGTQIDFEKLDERIQVTLAVRKDGFIWTNPFIGPGYYPHCREQDLRARLNELAGVRCRTISAKALLEEKERYASLRNVPPRSKDIEAMEALRRLLERERRGAPVRVS